jgi:hypothetical protein
MPGYSPQTVYPFAVNGLLLISQIWVIIYGGRYSFTSRIVITFMLSAVVLITIPILAHLGGGLGFWTTFLVLFLFGIVTGVCQASVFSLAGGLPFKYMGAVMLGQGIAGIASNIFRALSLIIWPVSKSPGNMYKGALAYFLLASLFMVICGLCQFVLKKNEFAVYHLWQNPGFKPKWEDLSPMIPKGTIPSSSSSTSPMRLAKKPPLI